MSEEDYKDYMSESGLNVLSGQPAKKELRKTSHRVVLHNGTTCLNTQLSDSGSRHLLDVPKETVGQRGITPDQEN